MLAVFIPAPFCRLWTSCWPILGADGGLLVKLPAWHCADPLLPAGAASLPLCDALAR
jgi:hypothetical protein